MLTLARALSDQGVELALVCPAGELAQRAASEGIREVYSVEPTTQALNEGRLQDCIRLWRACLHHVRRGDHVVIFSYYLLALAPGARPLLHARGVKITLDLHDQLVTPKARLGVQAGSMGVDSVIACSRFTASQLSHRPRVSYLHRAVSRAAKRTPLGAGGPAGARRPEACDGYRPLRVGIVGRISEEKRHLLLIDAVCRLGPRAVLVVRGAGDGFSDRYTSRVLAYGRDMLGERFVCEGRVPPDEALDHLDVLVVGNPQEPMGRTVLEAQSQGVIAIVPDSGGASELVEDGVTGLQYIHDDAVDLAATIAKVAGDATLASRITQTAMQRVPQPEDYAQDYRRLLEAMS